MMWPNKKVGAELQRMELRRFRVSVIAIPDLGLSKICSPGLRPRLNERASMDDECLWGLVSLLLAAQPFAAIFSRKVTGIEGVDRKARKDQEKPGDGAARSSDEGVDE
ncbi:MAG: hypothetical protein ACI8X5_002167 [Planctomycetota bacterium]|jgi:hypothetical protein